MGLSSLSCEYGTHFLKSHNNFLKFHNTKPKLAAFLLSRTVPSILSLEYRLLSKLCVSGLKRWQLTHTHTRILKASSLCLFLTLRNVMTLLSGPVSVYTRGFFLNVMAEYIIPLSLIFYFVLIFWHDFTELRQSANCLGSPKWCWTSDPPASTSQVRLQLCA